LKAVDTFLNDETEVHIDVETVSAERLHNENVFNVYAYRMKTDSYLDHERIHFDNVPTIHQGTDFVARMEKLMFDVSVVLPDDVNFGYAWGSNQISFNTIGDPNIILVHQDPGNTRYDALTKVINFLASKLTYVKIQNQFIPRTVVP
jgi:hypothetical protein